VIDDLLAKHIPEGAYPEQWDVTTLHNEVQQYLNLDVSVSEWAKEEGIADEEMRERLRVSADNAYAARREKNTSEVMLYVEKQVILQSLDHLWREHLVTLDHLRQVIGWRGYAQRDPLNEYKSEAFELFNELITKLREDVTAQLMRVEVMFEVPPEPQLPEMQGSHLDPLTGENEMRDGYGMVAPALERQADDEATWGKVGRNEPCPCGSGKKFKHCHGSIIAV
jgi:preprotein translocase subunit SecA